MYSTRHSCQIFMNLEFFIQIFYKILKFHENLSSGVELFYADGRTDRRDEDNSRFSQFCGRA